MQNVMTINDEARILNLMVEMGVATENLDDVYIEELKPQLIILKAKFPNNEHILIMEGWIEEMVGDIEWYSEYKWNEG